MVGGDGAERERAGRVGAEQLSAALLAKVDLGYCVLLAGYDCDGS